MKFIMIPADSHVYLMVDNATYICILIVITP